MNLLQRDERGRQAGVHEVGPGSELGPAAGAHCKHSCHRAQRPTPNARPPSAHLSKVESTIPKALNAVSTAAGRGRRGGGRGD